MKLLERLAMKIWSIAHRSDATERLDAKLSETMHAANQAVSTARGAAVGSASDRRAAEEVLHQVQGRIAQQAVRRQVRMHDPKLAVIQDTVRILENRR